MSLTNWLQQRRMYASIEDSIDETKAATRQAEKVAEVLRYDWARNEARAKKFDNKARSVYEQAKCVRDPRLLRKYIANMAIAESRSQMYRDQALNLHIAVMDYETIYEEALEQLEGLEALANGNGTAINPRQIIEILERNSSILAKLKGNSGRLELISAIKRLWEKEEQSFEAYALADQALSTISEEKILQILEPERHSKELQSLLGSLKELEKQPAANLKQVAAVAT